MDLIFQCCVKEKDGDVEKVVGYEVVRKPAEFRLLLRKMVLLREALLYLAGRPVVSTEVLRSLMGMWIFGALLRRELLSIPHSLFRFIDKHAGETIGWWPTARREVRTMAACHQPDARSCWSPSATVAFCDRCNGRQ